MAITALDLSGEDLDPVGLAAKLRDVADRISELSSEDVETAGLWVGGLQSWMTALLAQLTARAARLQQTGQKADPVRLAKSTGLDGRDADRAIRRGDALAKMPEAHAALAEGRIGQGHADVLARQSGRLDGSKKKQFEAASRDLVDTAADEGSSVSTFEKRCREKVDVLMGDDGVGEFEKQEKKSSGSVWDDPESGMTNLFATWDPVRGAEVSNAIDAEVAARIALGSRVSTPRQRKQLTAAAVHGLLTGDRKSKTGAGGVALNIHIDLEALIDGLRQTPDGKLRLAELEDGRQIPIETIRRLACDAGILPIVLNGDSEVLDVGRQKRLATRAQRNALRAVYPTCGMTQDCDVPFDHCQIHHVTQWEHGGQTNLEAMVPGCNQHHHLIHEGGWTLSRRPDGTWQLTPPAKPDPPP